MNPDHIVHTVAMLMWAGVGLSALSAAGQFGWTLLERRSGVEADRSRGIALSVMSGALFGSALLILALAGVDVPGPHLPWAGIGIGIASIAGVAVVVAGTAQAGEAVRRRRGERHANRRERAAVEARHDAVVDAYGLFQTDILSVLDRPQLADVSVPETADLIRALAHARDAREHEGVRAYRRAVTELESAWTIADEAARRAGTDRLPDKERQQVEQAHKLLATALDEGGNENERRAAYQRAMRLLDGIVTIPRQAVAEIEQRTRPQLDKQADA